MKYGYDLSPCLEACTLDGKAFYTSLKFDQWNPLAEFTDNEFCRPKLPSIRLDVLQSLFESFLKWPQHPRIGEHNDMLSIVFV